LYSLIDGKAALRNSLPNAEKRKEREKKEEKKRVGQAQAWHAEQKRKQQGEKKRKVKMGSLTWRLMRQRQPHQPRSVHCISEPGMETSALFHTSEHSTAKYDRYLLQ
jgi:chromatin remodeling complex protein RSC6